MKFWECIRKFSAEVFPERSLSSQTGVRLLYSVLVLFSMYFYWKSQHFYMVFCRLTRFHWSSRTCAPCRTWTTSPSMKLWITSWSTRKITRVSAHQLMPLTTTTTSPWHKDWRGTNWSNSDVSLRTYTEETTGGSKPWSYQRRTDYSR